MHSLNCIVGLYGLRDLYARFPNDNSLSRLASGSIRVYRLRLHNFNSEDILLINTQSERHALQLKRSLKESVDVKRRITAPGLVPIFTDG